MAEQPTGGRGNMIVRSDKTWATTSEAPNSNFDEGCPDAVVIDETTDEGMALAFKVTQYYPYFELVKDGSGKIIDVISTRITVECPEAATVNQDILLTITCKDEAEATVVIGTVIDGYNSSTAETVDISDGEGSFVLNFSAVGTYTVNVSTLNHGSVEVRMVVS